MSDLIIDPIDFSRQQREISGQWPVTALDRVKTAVIEDDALVSFIVSGAVDANRRAVLSVRVAGEVHMVCQRCLEPVTVPLAISTDITVFVYEDRMAEAEADNPDLEALMLDDARDVKVLVEDEILLDLPFAPLHDECADLPYGEDEEKLPAASPFAALAALKQRN